jgi:hypothetical protein
MHPDLAENNMGRCLGDQRLFYAVLANRWIAAVG